MKRIDRGETSSLIAFRLQPSLSLQIVTTAPPFQLRMAVFFQVIWSASSVHFLSTRIF